MRFSEQALRDNHRQLEERTAIHLRHGIDDQAALSFVLEQARPLSGRVLEIGTGKGRFLTELLKHASNVTSVDVSAEEQRYARMNVAWTQPPGRARFVVGDATRLPWRRRTFDYVVSMNTLHHIQDLKVLLHEAVRVTRRNGRIVLADMDEATFIRMAALHRKEGRTHERYVHRMKDASRHLKALGWNTKVATGAGQCVLVAEMGIPRKA